MTEPSIKDRIRAARLPERTVSLCLRGDLVAAFEDLERRLAGFADAATAGMLNDPAAAERRKIAEEMTRLRTQMREDTLTIRIRALPASKWTVLTESHPSKQADLLFDPTTFWPAALQACTVDPTLDDDDWDALIGDDGVLSNRQFADWCSAVWEINRSEIDIPFSPTASGILLGSENGSKPPNG